MKRKMLVISTLLAMILTTTAFAAEARSPAVMPSLSFSGTTATCSVSVYGDSATDEIIVEVELWHGKTLVKSWSDKSTQYVVSSRKVTVTKGEEYTLKAYATVNGKTLPMADITKTCK